MIGELTELIKVLIVNGWLVAAAVISWNIWRYSTGRIVPLRTYLEMKEERNYWREDALHGTRQVTTLINDKDIGLATIESIESHIEENNEVS